VSPFRLWLEIARRMREQAPVRSFLILPLSFIVVAGQLVGSGALVGYLGSKITDRPTSIRIPLGSIDADSLLSSDAAWVALIAIVSILGVALSYAERRYQLELGKSFSLAATRRSMGEIGIERSTLGYDPGTLVRASAAHAATVAPIAKAVVLAAVLIWLRWDLALILLAASASVAIPLQRRLRRRIVLSSAERRTGGRDFKDATKTAGARLGQTTDPVERQTIIDGYTDSEALNERVRLGLAIREVQQRSSLMAGVVTAVGSVGIAITVAATPDNADGQASLVGLVFFAIVLAMFYTAVREFLGNLSTFHKHEHTLKMVLEGERSVVARPGSVAYTERQAPTDGPNLETWIRSLGLGDELAPILTSTSELREIADEIILSTEGSASTPLPIERVTSILDRTTSSGATAVAVQTSGEPAIVEGWTIAAARKTPGIVVVPAYVFDNQRPGQIRALLKLVTHHLVVVTGASAEVRAAVEGATGKPGIDLDAAPALTEDGEDDEWD
jgi:membrane protein implicated in regulation of membrane protease activity